MYLLLIEKEIFKEITQVNKIQQWQQKTSVVSGFKFWKA